MKKLCVAIGTDHRGLKEKNRLKEFLEQEGYKVMDVGTHSTESCDHPDFAFMAGELVAEGKADRVILICGSGHGMLISVNKVPGIMAVMPINEEHAKMSREHNDANGLCFGSEITPLDQVLTISKTWLETDHLGGRYSRRARKILEYEQRKMSKPQ